MGFKKPLITLVFALFLTSHVNATEEPFDQAVSLGFGCQVVWQLETNGLRKLAYPFDWFHTPINSLILFISNKGANFLDLDKIEVKRPYPGDPLRLEVVDLVYGIVSYHDFLTSPSLGNYAQIKDKYDRRIQRFFDLLNSKKKVLFIRQGSHRAEIEYLDNFLHDLYPNLSYKILAVGNTEEYRHDWGLERIKNFHIPEKPWDWQGDFPRWKEVLSQFSIKPSLEPRPIEEQW